MAAQMSEHDTAIWYAIQITELIGAGRLEQWPGEPAPFVMRLGEGERALTTGGYMLYDYGALGDGSYEHQGGMFMATGRGGLAMTAGFMAAQAFGNSSRRKAAERAAQERWRPLEQGQIWVTEHGFYRASQYGMTTWGYGDIDAAQLVAPGNLWFSGQSSQGPISWIVESTWAELILLLWARAVGVQHPQTMDVGWIPPGWVERVQGAGVALPQALTPTSPLRGILPAG